MNNIRLNGILRATIKAYIALAAAMFVGGIVVGAGLALAG
jgi:hypothetical protein